MVIHAGSAVMPDQAIGMLSELKLLLGADSFEPSQASAPLQIPEHATTHRGSPRLTWGQESGQTASCDSARSHANQQSAQTNTAEQASAPPSITPDQPVPRAAPPPPSHTEHAKHAEHAVQQPPQMLESLSASSLSPQSRNKAKGFSPDRSGSSYGLQWSAGGMPQRPIQAGGACMVSPFDIARRHSTEQKGSSLAKEWTSPRRRSAEQQRFADWTGQQAKESAQDLAGRRLSSFTQAELGALQAHDRGMQGQQLQVQHRSHPPHLQDGSERRCSAELKGPSVGAISTQDGQQSSTRGSSIEILESLNCQIVDYDQLQIKRKIGAGSIGRVS